jgi:hypothetical protein
MTGMPRTGKHFTGSQQFEAYHGASSSRHWDQVTSGGDLLADEYTRTYTVIIIDYSAYYRRRRLRILYDD